MPATPTEPTATLDALRNLYPSRPQPGGFLIVKDYGFDHCRAGG